MQWFSTAWRMWPIASIWRYRLSNSLLSTVSFRLGFSFCCARWVAFWKAFFVSQVSNQLKFRIFFKYLSHVLAAVCEIITKMAGSFAYQLGQFKKKSPWFHHIVHVTSHGYPLDKMCSQLGGFCLSRSYITPPASRSNLKGKSWSLWNFKWN